MTNESKKTRILQAMTETAKDLEMAMKRLSDSTECQKRFGDHEEWVAVDQERVKSLETHMKYLEQMFNEVA